MILNAVKELYPNYQFNSAMITRYASGEEWMPFHSDDETCIAPHSSIMTISFGDTRSLQFQSIHTPHKLYHAFFQNDAQKKHRSTYVWFGFQDQKEGIRKFGVVNRVNDQK